MASYETSAKDFLYPYSTARIQYAGVRRQILLGRTIDFPGVAPSLEFIVSPSVDDATGITSAIKTHKYTKPINSYGKTVNNFLKTLSYLFPFHLAKTIKITNMETIIDLSKSVIFY